MKMTPCSQCGAKARIIRGDYVWQDIDLPVLLKNIELVECAKCGNTDPIIPKLRQLMRLLAVAVIRKPYRLMGGELRFLRKYLGMTGADFAALLQVDKTTLSKWENDDDPIGGQSDRLIRMLALELGDGMKTEMERLKAQLTDWIRSFPTIDKQARKVQIRLDPKKMSYEQVAA